MADTNGQCSLLKTDHTGGTVEWHERIPIAGTSDILRMAASADHVYLCGTRDMGGSAPQWYIARIAKSNGAKTHTYNMAASGETWDAYAITVEGSWVYGAGRRIPSAGDTVGIISKWASSSLAESTTRSYGKGTFAASGTAIVGDGSSNVYAAFHCTDSTTTVVKQDSSENITWQRELDWTGYTSFYIRNLIYDGGAIYAFGDGVDGSSIQACYLIKWNSSGTLQWKKKLEKFDGTTFLQAKGMVADSTGNIYVYIRNWLTAGPQFMSIVKFTSGGVVTWARDIDKDASSSTLQEGISIDSDDNPVVIGFDNLNNHAMMKIPADGSLTGEYGSVIYTHNRNIKITADTALTEGAGNLVKATITESSSSVSTTFVSVSATDNGRTSVKFLTRDLYRTRSGSIHYCPMYEDHSVGSNTTKSLSMSDAHTMGIDRVNKQIYVCDEIGDVIVSVDVTTPTAMVEDDSFSHASIGFPVSPVVDTARDILFVATADTDNVVAINVATRTALAYLDDLVAGGTVGGGANIISIDTDTDHLYMTRLTSDAFIAMNTSTATALVIDDTQAGSAAVNIYKSSVFCTAKKHIFGVSRDASGDYWITSIDASNPAALAISDEYEATGMDVGSNEGMLIVGHYLYVQGLTKLWTFDITDPTAISLVDTLTDATNFSTPNYYITAAPYNGDFLYLTSTNFQHIHVIDITDQANPVMAAGSVLWPGSAYSTHMVMDTRG
jgi:hypothetical protein